MDHLRIGESILLCWSNFTNIDEFSFLYSFFLAIDANFKLKQKDRGIKDIELAPGWGCYVESSRYDEHVKRHVDEPEVGILYVFLLVF